MLLPAAQPPEQVELVGAAAVKVVVNVVVTIHLATLDVTRALFLFIPSFSRRLSSSSSSLDLDS